MASALAAGARNCRTVARCASAMGAGWTRRNTFPGEEPTWTGLVCRAMVCACRAARRCRQAAYCRAQRCRSLIETCSTGNVAITKRTPRECADRISARSYAANAICSTLVVANFLSYLFLWPLSWRSITMNSSSNHSHVPRCRPSCPGDGTRSDSRNLTLAAFPVGPSCTKASLEGLMEAIEFDPLDWGSCDHVPERRQRRCWATFRVGALLRNRAT